MPAGTLIRPSSDTTTAAPTSTLTATATPAAVVLPTATRTAVPGCSQGPSAPPAIYYDFVLA
jgi:hypothetical protein